MLAAHGISALAEGAIARHLQQVALARGAFKCARTAGKGGRCRHYRIWTNPSLEALLLQSLALAALCRF